MQVYLSTETVECAARAFESIDDVERSDGLALGVFSVCDRITNDLQKLLGQRQVCRK